MIRFLLGRFALLVVGIGIAALLIFFTLRVLPGDVAQVVGGLKATPDQLESIREHLGLNRSLGDQFVSWIGGLLRLDLGTSLITGSAVAGELGQKMQVTLPLTVLSLTIALVIAVPLGIWTALRHDRVSGIVLNAGAQSLAAVPALWLGLLLILLLARGIGIAGVLPAGGFPRAGWGDPVGAVVALLLPAITVGLIEGAILLRFVRSAALTALNQDYVRTAVAKGLTVPQALVRHGLPNVGLSVITVSALTAAGLITGAVLVESLFNLPGVGRMLVTDVGARDLPKVQSSVLLLTGVVLVIGAAVDVLHRVIDPRQRERTAA